MVPPLFSLNDMLWTFLVVIPTTALLACDLLAKATVLMLGPWARNLLVEFGLKLRIRPNMFVGSLILRTILVSKAVAEGELLEGPTIIEPL